MYLLYKLSFIKIKKNIGRFLSVLFIIALGVGFYAGLNETTPDIKRTLDNYYDETNLMDFKIISTMGLTEDDVLSLKELKNIEKAIPSYSTDALIDGREVRVHAIEEEINNVKLLEGRMPNDNNECLADITKYKIGDKIIVSKTSQEDVLTNLEYVVVGLVKSPLYLSRQLGIASIGTGELDSFIYIPKDNFKSKLYTEIYLTAKGTKEEIAYEEKYEEISNLLLSELEELKPIRETKRYEEILEEATIEIRKIETEANNEISEAENKLDDALDEINKGKNELNNAKEQIATSIDTINKEEEQGLSQIENAKNDWNKNYNLFINSLSQAGLSEDTLQLTLNDLNKQIESIEQTLSLLPDSDPSYETYQSMLNNLNQEKNNLETLIQTKEQLDSAKIEIEKNEKELKEKINEAREKINQSQTEIKNNEEKIDSAYSEYLDGVNTLNEQKEEVNNEIKKAKEELNKIEKPKWYLLDRDTNNGYSSIWDDALKVDSISAIFPIFFIIVVALMCFNTMDRMIEEERGEIGILSSLGYSNFKIINGYLFYISLATVIGVIVGLLIGYTLIPNIIYSIYHANYILPTLNININISSFFIIILVTLILMYIVVIVSSLKELKNVPATILRPKAPKAGKKIFLEHIKIIWRRLNFTSKVTVRNMFRYKKRIIMTVLGVVGSTALLLTGFGLKDSISSLGDLQYGKINHYDALFVFSEQFTKLSDDTINKLNNNNNITEYLEIYQSSYTFEAKELTHDAYLVAISNPDELDKFITLNSKVNEEFEFPSNGVVISEKMAELLNVEIGDFIKIRNSDNELVVLPVSEIVENYTLHYIYINESTYEKYFEKELEYNMIMANLSDNIDYDKLSREWVEEGLVSTINYTEDNVLIFDNMIGGLNLIVLLIIAASCMLTFIVLYNLTTINIAERIREISTLKVLGFYDKEVSNYVYRETLLLTIIGIILGLITGVFLHMYVIDVAETDNMLFLHKIKFSSYLYSFLIIIFFTIIVQILTNKKLKKIDMIESLKSVE